MGKELRGLAKRLERMNGWETAFVIYTAGWTLDRFATTVRGSRQLVTMLTPWSWSMGGGYLPPIYGTGLMPVSSRKRILTTSRAHQTD